MPHNACGYPRHSPTMTAVKLNTLIDHNCHWPRLIASRSALASERLTSDSASTAERTVSARLIDTSTSRSTTPMRRPASFHDCFAVADSVIEHLKLVGAVVASRLPKLIWRSADRVSHAGQSVGRSDAGYVRVLRHLVVSLGDLPPTPFTDSGRLGSLANRQLRSDALAQLFNQLRLWRLRRYLHRSTLLRTHVRSLVLALSRDFAVTRL